MPDPGSSSTLLCASPGGGAARWDLATGVEVGTAEESDEDNDEDNDNKSEGELAPTVSDDRDLPSAVLWSCAVNAGRHRLIALSTHDRPYRSVFHYGAQLQLLSLTDLDIAVLPRAVTARVKLLLGAMGNNTLLFLGVDGWIQSYDLSPHLRPPRSGSPVMREDSVTRHFYVPKNWLNHPRAHLISIAGNGMLLCPVQGGVAIVKNGLRI